MSLINKAALLSRAIRTRLAGGGGVRKVATSTLTKEGGVWEKFLGLLGKITPFLGGIWNWFTRGGRTLGSWISQIFGGGVLALLQYNWNQSDADIDAQIKATNLAVVGNWGEAFGSLLAGVVVLGTTYMIPKIGPIIAKMAAFDIGSEIYDEFDSALRITMQSGILNSARVAYKNIRAYIKGPIGDLLGANKPAFLEKWGTGGKPWTIYGAIQEQIENIPNEYIQVFVEEGFDSLIEKWFSFVSIVGMRVDDYITLQAQGNDYQKGNERKVEVVVDPDNNQSAPLVLYGRESALVPAISTVVAQAQYFHGKEIVESKYRLEFSRSKTSENRERSLLIVFKNQPEPPWRRPGVQYREWSYNIPTPKQGLSFSQIKLACGGAAGRYFFGKWRANANLSSGKISVYANSSLDAEKRRDGLLSLSQDENNAKSLTVSEVKLRVNNTNWLPDPEPCYPVLAILRVRRFRSTGKKLDLERGEKYDDEFFEMSLWPDSPLPYEPNVFP